MRAVVLGHELVRAPGFADQRSLKGEKVGNPHLLPARPLKFVTGAGGIVAGRHVGPVVDVLAPVVKEPGLVERVRGAELFLQVVDEAVEDIVIGSAVGASLVIDLPADDRGIVFVVRHQVGNDALGIEAEFRIVGVHVLAHAVAHRSAAQRAGVELGMGLGHPGRHGISGRAHDDLDPGLAHGIDYAVHPGVFEDSICRLPKAPR